MTSGDLNACCSKKNAYRYGTFKRSSDSQNVQRFQCKTCKKTFSLATFDPQYYQKKRHLNYAVMMMLASGVSMRRIRLGIVNLRVKKVQTRARGNLNQSIDSKNLVHHQKNIGLGGSSGHLCLGS